MPRFSAILAFISALTIFSCSQSVTADDIIKKNIEARGGHDKIKSLRSVIFEGVSITQGSDIAAKLWYVHKKAMRSDFTYNGKTAYTILSTDGGWTFSPFDGKGLQPMAPKNVEEGLFQLDIQGLFIDYKDKGYNAEYLGKDTADGETCYQVKLTKQGEGDKIYLFDEFYKLRKTIISRLAADGKFQPSSNYFYDYRKEANGFLFSYRRLDGRGFETIYTSILTNTEIPDSLFKPVK